MKSIYITEMFWKKIGAQFESKKIFIVGIQGEIKISPDFAARLKKQSIIQMTA